MRYLLVSAILVLTLLLVPAQSASSDDVDTKISEEVWEEAQSEETVSVIINLEESSSNHNTLGASAADSIAEEIEDMGGEVTHIYQSISSIAAEVPVNALNELESNQDIENVVSNGIKQLFLQDSVPLIKANSAHTVLIDPNNITGGGVGVCIIDTGVDYNHASLGGGFGSGFKVTGGYDFCADDATCSTEDSNPLDVHGHGTHVAGIVAASGGMTGVAPNATIIAIKVFNSTGFATDADVIAGIDWCISNRTAYNIKVISMSLGAGSFSSACDNVASETPYRDAINNAVSKNMTVVVATGNSGSSSVISSPACITNATKVTASDKNDAYASFANRAFAFSDILVAPGVNINSTCISGTYCEKNGTSMSTPHVAGLAALIYQTWKYRQGNEPTTIEIFQKLNSTGVALFDSATNATFYRINASSAVNAIATAPKITNWSNSVTNNDSLEISANDDSTIHFNISKITDSQSVSYNWSVNGSSSTTSQNFTKSFGFNDTKTWLIKAEINNTNGTGIKIWTVNINNVNRVPKISLNSNLTVSLNSNYTYNLNNSNNISDEDVSTDSDSVTITTSDPGNITVSGLNLIFRYNEAVYQKNITITANDSSNSTNSTTILITTNNEFPKFSKITVLKSDNSAIVDNDVNTYYYFNNATIKLKINSSDDSNSTNLTVVANFSNVTGNDSVFLVSNVDGTYNLTYNSNNTNSSQFIKSITIKATDNANNTNTTSFYLAFNINPLNVTLNSNNTNHTLNGTTTNWSSSTQITDFSSVSALTFDVPSVAKAYFYQALNLTDKTTAESSANIANNVYIVKGRFEINVSSSAFASLNSSANITFYNTTNNLSDVFFNGANCSAPRCTNITWTGDSTNGFNVSFNSSEMGKYEIDITAPTITTALNASPNPFSPNASSGIKDETYISFKATEDLYTSSNQMNYTILIAYSNGTQVKNFTGNFTHNTLVNFSWDGKDSNGNFVAEGNYTISGNLTDKAQNLKNFTKNSVIIDNTAPTSQASGIDLDDSITTSKIRVKWTGVSGAASYKVYQRTVDSDALSDYKLEKETTDVEVDLADLASKTQYFIVVTAIDSAGNENKTITSANKGSATTKEVVLPATTGSNSGGGSAAATDVVQEVLQIVEAEAKVIQSEIKTISRIVPNSPPEIAIFDSSKVDIAKISLVVKKEATSVEVKVDKYDKKPTTVSQPKDNTYSYLEITASNLPADSIEAATIEFSVPYDWLFQNKIKANDIVFMRYSGSSWSELDTIHLSSDDNQEYYRANTPGFSTFAIAAKNAETTVESSSNSATNKITGSSIDNGITNWKPVLFILFILGAIGAGVAILRKDWKKDNQIGLGFR